MALTAYTTYDTVRAVVGLSPKELSDDVLSLPMYEQLLKEDLYSVASELNTTFLALPGGMLSAYEQKLKDQVEVFAAYSVAEKLLSPAGIFCPQVINDGRASRDTGADPYANLRVDVPKMLAVLRTRITITLDLLAVTSTVSVRTYALTGSTGLASDPVTGA